MPDRPTSARKSNLPVGHKPSDAIGEVAAWSASGLETMMKGKPALASGRGRGEDIDRYVGGRMRARRIMLGLTQQQMADIIGVTYQQAHKYEKGVNRIAAGRLYQIAQALGVKVGFFFEDLNGAGDLSLLPQQRMLLELARNFIAIPNRRHQEAICSLVRVLAGEVEPSGR
jgi:transcriptional regulator with XRE-family HTH domain